MTEIETFLILDLVKIRGFFYGNSSNGKVAKRWQKCGKKVAEKWQSRVVTERWRKSGRNKKVVRLQ